MVDRALRRAIHLDHGHVAVTFVKATKDPGGHVLKMMKIQYVFLVSIVSVVVAGCVTETTRSRPMASTTDQTKKRVYTQEELQKTGQSDTGAALAKVDPSVQTTGPH